MAIPILILADPRNWAAKEAYANGSYRAGGTHRTFAATLSLGIAALIGVGLATALVAPQLIERGPGEIWTQFPETKEPLPPPPPKPEAKDEEAKPETPTNITTVKPPIDVPVITAGPEVPFVDAPVPPVSNPAPTGDRTVLVPTAPPPPVAEPVFNRATINQRYMRDFQPRYPMANERAEIEGSCRVRVAINAQGRVNSVAPVNCPDNLFFEATRQQAMNSWRFNPATRDGTPVESTLEQTVRFEIQRR